jgi:rubrerythrin
MHELPAGAPSTMTEAFQHIAVLDNPSVGDLKVMVMLEAAGLRLYQDLAAGTDRKDVHALLLHNGREELAHAHRVAKAIGKLTGTDYPVPEPEENPYLAGPQPQTKPVTVEVLQTLAQAEFNGKNLYERWAANCGNAEAAALFRLNGREEAEHGARLQQAAELLAA